MNRCPKIEYAKFSGELGWAGVNSNVISNKRNLKTNNFSNPMFGVIIRYPLSVRFKPSFRGLLAYCICLT